jgi:hypothetical protein
MRSVRLNCTPFWKVTPSRCSMAIILGLTKDFWGPAERQWNLKSNVIVAEIKARLEKGILIK